MSSTVQAEVFVMNVEIVRQYVWITLTSFIIHISFLLGRLCGLIYQFSSLNSISFKKTWWSYFRYDIMGSIHNKKDIDLFSRKCYYSHSEFSSLFNHVTGSNLDFKVLLVVGYSESVTSFTREAIDKSMKLTKLQNLFKLNVAPAGIIVCTKCEFWENNAKSWYHRRFSPGHQMLIQNG